LNQGGAMEVCVFARLHARPLLDHPFKVSLAEQIW
jgi:hypothetical protein